MSEQEFNIKFVGTVEKHEILYNYQLPEYSRKDLTSKAWQEVAEELKMPVSDCKERWKNLRTVFMRKSKPAASGSGTKKAYYLQNAMQFCLPFIKTVLPPSTGNLPRPSTEPSCIETQYQSDIEYSQTQDEDKFRVNESIFEEANPAPVSKKRKENSMKVNTEMDNECYEDEQPNMPAMPKKNKKKLSSAAEADRSVSDFFKAKRALLNASHEPDESPRQKGIRSFCNSLIPELEEMTDSQIKIFRRRVFVLIDDIINSEKERSASSGPNYTYSLTNSTENTEAAETGSIEYLILDTVDT